LAHVARIAIALANAGLWVVERALWPRLPAEPQRVGLWRVGMLGDTLAALPALAVLRARHPRARLVLFTSPGPDRAPGARELLADLAGEVEIVRWTREDLERDGARGLIARLRAARVDLLHVLPQDRTTPRVELRNLLALALSGQGGVRGARLGSAQFLPPPLRHSHDRASLPVPESERLLALVGGAPRGARAVAPLDLVGPRRRARLAADLARAGTAPLLCLAPGGKLEHKRWSPTSFGRAARAWIDAGGRVAVLGGPGDADLARAVAAAAERDVTDLCGAYDVLDSACLLERAAVLLTNDTGTMHLAAAVGTPLVAVFSGYDRAGAWTPWRRPDGGEQVLLRHATPCSPCHAESCAERRAGQPACLAGVTVESAVAALFAVAKEVPGASRAVAA